MARKGFIIHDQRAIYFLTFTVSGWIDSFSRESARAGSEYLGEGLS